VIAGGLDRRDALEKPLQKRVIGCRAGLHPRLPVGVAERKAFTDAGQRIVVQAGRPIGIDALAERGQLGVRKKLPQHGAAAVRGAACQPSAADSMAVDAITRRGDRVVAVNLQHQGAAE